MPSHRTVVQATYAASVAKVWDAWTKGEQWGAWFSEGPARIDLRVGGRYWTPDGDEGEYLEIVPHELLRFTWEHEHHRQSSPGSIVTLRFHALGPHRTRLVLTHSRLGAADAADMRGGWSWARASLGSYLATGRGMKEAEWLAATGKADGGKP
jgi:uncharacterized protein YndB with AHSA1/START domain